MRYIGSCMILAALAIAWLSPHLARAVDEFAVIVLFAVTLAMLGGWLLVER